MASAICISYAVGKDRAPVVEIQDGDFTDAILFVEDETSQKVLCKSVFNEFWSAVDQALLMYAAR